MLITCSYPLSNIQGLSTFLQQQVRFSPLPILLRPSRVSGVLTWGKKPTGRCAIKRAHKYALPLIYLEDGFLRSFGLGVSGAPPLSLIVDTIGIYYDATQPSQLENLLNHTVFSETQLAQGQQALTILHTEQLSKYNQGKPVPPSTFSDNSKSNNIKRVLLVDQTKGDASVTYGMANEQTFQTMLQNAQKEHPSAEIWIKTHPDVLSGKKQGYFNPQQTLNSNIHWLTEDYHPHDLLEHFDHVYVVTSQMGLDALIVGKPVTCFGMPFYAGWGLTDDRQICHRRRRKLSLVELITASYLLYPRYLDPETQQLSDFFHIAAFIARQKQMQRWWHDLTPTPWSGRIFCFGMKYWRRALIRPFFGEQNQVIFVNTVAEAKQANINLNDRLTVWGRRDSEEIRILAQRLQTPLIHIEDGFLRSVGLGADFVSPGSLVFDAHGIYFDPSKPSDLEMLLLACPPLTPEKEAEVSWLKQMIIQHRLTKYNVEDDTPLKLETQDKRIILIPGQVEDDASIRYGSPEISTNLKLIQIVREKNPNAFIIYKPHPDVSAHHRIGKVSLKLMRRYCDHIADNASAIACIETADEIHTMTSLLGFDALLRRKIVFTYGSPFYAGWGLTQDHHPLQRRTKNHLTLDQLITMSLIDYPRYYNPHAQGFISLSAHIHGLIQTRQNRSTTALIHPLNYPKKLIIFLSNLWKSWRISR